MKKALILLTFLALALSPAFGQEEPQPPQPATSQEVRSLERKLNKLLENQKNSDKNVKSLGESIQDVRKDAQGATKAAEAAGQKAVDAIRSESGKNEDDRLRQAQLKRYVLIGIAVLFSIGAASLLLQVKRRSVVKETIKETVVREVVVQQPSETIKLHTNPPQDVLRSEISEKGEGQFILAPNPDDDIQFDPVVLDVRNVPGERYLKVRFPGETRWMGWRDKSDHARKLHLQKSNVIEMKERAS